MRLTFIFLLLGFMQVAASSTGQNVKLSIDMKDATIREVLQKIENQSKYRFAYSSQVIDLSRKVDISLNEQPVESILYSLFAGTDIRYEIDNRLVMLYGNDEKAAGQQGRTVTGKVTGQDGEPLPGVTIVVKGTTTGIITDVDGNYSVPIVSDDAVLVFSFVGMRTIEMAVQGKDRVNIVMEEETIGLEEVVAIGYGVQKKSDLTGAASRLTADDLDKSVAKSPVEMMQGRVSGVNITANNGEPGAGMSVQIRGSHSIRSGQTPLYVVDGVPLDNVDLTPDGTASVGGVNGSSSKNPISFLNTEDIESIDVLKDASATAIYGSRGANGVVIITTKSGRKGAGEIDYNGYLGVSSIREKLDVLTADEFRTWFKNNSIEFTDKEADINWQDEIFRTAITNNHDISFGGGSDKNTYRVSLGYVDEQGIVANTGMEKINGRTSFSQKMFDGRVTLSAGIIASHVKDRRTLIGETGGYEGDIILTALKLNPTFPVYNSDGSYFQYSTIQRNPVAMIRYTNDITLTDRVIGNVSADIKLTKGLTYRLNVGLDRAIAERKINQNNKLTYLTNKGEADINSIKADNKLLEHYFTYMKDINRHQINILLGYSYQKLKKSTGSVNVKGFTVEGILYSDNLEYGDFSSAVVSSSAEESELQSFFGRANYGFNRKYLFTLTGRFDGSTKFGENNRYGFFPSAAFAWRASEEDFIRDMNVFSNLKVRLGWGKTGNQEIPNKISQMLVGTSADANGFFGGSLSTGIAFQRTPNPDLKWETTEQSNLGIDFGFLENRLNGTLDVFYKNTTDVLLELNAIAPSPTATQWQNVDCKIINKGIDLGLNAIIVDRKNLTWDAGINFSLVDNKVKDLPVTLIETGVASGQGLSDVRVQIITNNQPIGTFYGRVFEGFDANGMGVHKKDSNGREIAEYLGSALPDFTYSFKTGLTWQNFDFGMFWYGSQGNKVYNNTANALFYKATLKNGYNVVKDAAYSAESIDNSPGFSSRFIEDGSFLRLQNITLGYTFNTRSIPLVRKARVYATGNNLLIITGYSGFDPEVNSNAEHNNVPSLGIDYTSYPKPRTFTFGINLQF